MSSCGLVEKVQFSSDGTRFAVVDNDGYLAIWDIATGAAGVRFRSRQLSLDSVSPDLKYALTATFVGESGNYVWELWRLADGVMLADFPKGDSYLVPPGLFSPDDTFLALDDPGPSANSCTGRQGPRDCTDQVELFRTGDQRDSVRWAGAWGAFNHDGTVAATIVKGGCTTQDGARTCTQSRIALWNPATGQGLGSIPVGRSIRDVEFSRDGKLLAVSTDTGGQLWSTSTGKLIRKFSGGQLCGFSQQGKIIVEEGSGSGAATLVSSDEQVVRTKAGLRADCLWRTDAGDNVLFNLQTTSDPGYEKVVRRWDLGTRTRLPSIHDTRLMAISPAGSAIAVETKDTARIMDARAARNVRWPWVLGDAIVTAVVIGATYLWFRAREHLLRLRSARASLDVDRNAVGDGALFQHRKIWPIWVALSLALLASPWGFGHFALAGNGLGHVFFSVLLLTASMAALATAAWCASRICRSLRVTSAGIEVRLGTRRYARQWSEVTKVRAVAAPDGHQRLCLYPKLSTPLPRTWPRGAYRPFLDRRTGWITVSRLDGFGAPAPLVIDAVTRYAGPLWTDTKKP